MKDAFHFVVQQDKRFFGFFFFFGLFAGWLFVRFYIKLLRSETKFTRVFIKIFWLFEALKGLGIHHTDVLGFECDDASCFTTCLVLSCTKSDVPGVDAASFIHDYRSFQPYISPKERLWHLLWLFFFSFPHTVKECEKLFCICVA